MRLGCRFGRFLQKIVEPIDGFPVCSRDEVAVGVHSDLDGVVAQLLLDVYGAFPILKEKARVCMTQIVETDTTEPCLLQDRPEIPDDVGGVAKSSFFRREHQISDGLTLGEGFFRFLGLPGG